MVTALFNPIIAEMFFQKGHNIFTRGTPVEGTGRGHWHFTGHGLNASHHALREKRFWATQHPSRKPKAEHPKGREVRTRHTRVAATLQECGEQSTGKHCRSGRTVCPLVQGMRDRERGSV